MMIIMLERENRHDFQSYNNSLFLAIYFIATSTVVCR